MGTEDQGTQATVEVWSEALRKFQEDTETALLAFNPISTIELNVWLDEQEKNFKTFRLKGKSLRTKLIPVLDLVEKLSDIAGENISSVSQDHTRSHRNHPHEFCLGLTSK